MAASTTTRVTSTRSLGVNRGWKGYQERWVYYNVACHVLGM